MFEKAKERMLALRDNLEINAVHLIPETQKASELTASKRWEICQACEFLYKPTHTCKKCGCFMVVKTNLKRVKCPIGKWGPEETDV